MALVRCQCRSPFVCVHVVGTPNSTSLCSHRNSELVAPRWGTHFVSIFTFKWVEFYFVIGVCILIWSPTRVYTLLIYKVNMLGNPFKVHMRSMWHFCVSTHVLHDDSKWNLPHSSKQVCCLSLCIWDTCDVHRSDPTWLHNTSIVVTFGYGFKIRAYLILNASSKLHMWNHIIIVSNLLSKSTYDPKLHWYVQLGCLWK